VGTTIWIPVRVCFVTTDKRKHFLAGMLIAFWVGLFFGAWWGVAASVAAGVGKEAYDSRPGGTGWDWMDIAADGVGTAVGLCVLLCVKHIAGV
jgi:putative lipoprotein